MDITLRKYLRTKENLKKIPNDKDLGFGEVFTDHMFTMRWNVEQGWHDAIIKPYGPLELDPAAKILHYGQGIFEGMKAYWRGPDKFALFRHHDNAKRINQSAKRLCMPAIHPAIFNKALIELVKTDIRWIPKSHGCALYIRPSVIAVESGLGVSVAKEYLFYIILSPVGAYFKTGFSPGTIRVEEKMSRVADGGLGGAKAVGNYAASLLAGEQAMSEGCGQVLWLDAREHRFVEEVGAMNIFFVQINGTLLAPRLNGNILPGITRDSVIHLARKMGMSVVEAYFDINDIIKDIKNGIITEIFGSGTAAVIAPVGELCYKRKKIILDNEKAGPITNRFYKILTNIQYNDHSCAEYFGIDILSNKEVSDWIETINV